MESGWYWVSEKDQDPEIAYYSSIWDDWMFNYTEETRKTDQITVLQRIPDYVTANS